MRVRPLLFLLTVLLAAPVVAQQPDTPAAAQGDPVEMLIGIREQLGLTDVQVVYLRRIQERLERRNRPLVERLLEVQQQVQAQLVRADSGRTSSRRPTNTHLEIARAPMRRIQENNQEAMEDVGDVLTREQKRIANELLDLPSLENRRRGNRR